MEQGESLIFAALFELESGLLPKKRKPIARWLNAAPSQDAGTQDRRVGLWELPAPVES